MTTMSTAVNSDQVKTLRERSGAALMDCKRALVEAGGNLDKAALLLKEKGLAKAEKKASRATGQGLITSYLHQGRVGVLLEVACETDFVARCDAMQTLAKDLAMQIASMAPKHVSREQISPAELDKIKASFDPKGKSQDAQLEDWFTQYCLIDQPFIKDGSQRVKDVLVAAIAKIGENLVIKRFSRFELGEV